MTSARHPLLQSVDETHKALVAFVLSKCPVLFSRSKGKITELQAAHEKALDAAQEECERLHGELEKANATIESSGRVMDASALKHEEHAKALQEELDATKAKLEEYGHIARIIAAAKVNDG